MTLQETIEQIHPLSKEAMDRAKAHWDGIAKPLHSLGKLEDVLIQIAGITGKEEISIEKRALLTFCADNGVVEENVTQSGQEVTATVAENFLQEKATAAILCRGAHADLFPIDIGMARDTKVPRYKVAYGTKNMAKGPAMTREEAVRALETGIAVAEEKIAAGYQLMATGEMGIGNTTTSSAMAAVFLNQPVPELTGRGAGLSSEGLARKIAAIEKAIAINQPDPSDPIDVLAKVGGFDIAGMAGVFLAGAAHGVPVVMDGFISCVAAISLLVGGIGVMNIMLVSVTERTREIGIRMAIGARKRDIIGQFLVEASVVSCCGGVIGIVLGCFLSAVLGNLLLAKTQNSYMPTVEQFTVLPSAGLVIGAFLFSALLGIIFGLYPANKASNLQPVDALRTQ